MVVVGSVVLLAFGFASADVPIAALAPRRGALRILDQVHVVREANGQVRLVRSGAGPLRHLFDGGDAQAAEPWELRSAREIGIELDTVEGLAEQIPRWTAALVVLAELTAATELCERALASGGFPIVTGLLEPETMLVFGPQLANAVAASKAVEVTTAARGAERLAALARGDVQASTVAAILDSFLDAHVLDKAELGIAIDALIDAGLLVDV